MFGKVFKAYDVRGMYPNPLDETVAKKIGCAAGRHLRSKIQGRDASDPMLQHVVVGRDMRKSSPAMAEALIEGLRSAPVHVIDVGMVDTSFIYFAVNHMGTCGGIMVTASHNPPQYNGFKISGLEAKPVGSGSGLEEIQRTGATLEVDDMEPTGRLEQRDLWADYRKHIHRFLDLKRPLTVAVDASNGMGGALLPKVFEGVENLKLIPLNFEMTGEFVHDPNPLVAENMKPVQDLVREHGADLGACFDGDADRCMITDERGATVGCDHLGALFAPVFLHSDPGSAVVYDLRSSKALVEEIEKHGGKPTRSRVGHVFMKKVLRESGGAFGAELSGHFYYRDNFCTDSGAITFAQTLSILSAQDKPLSKLIEPIARYVQSGEINFEVEDKDGMLAELEEKYGGEAEIDKLDGVTIDAFDSQGWWFNVRKSNTEPLLRLNLEARDESLCGEKLAELKQMLGEPTDGH